MTTKPIPLYDATVPIACTASPVELDRQLARIDRFRTEVDAVERTEHGLLLRFPDRPGLTDELHAFTVAEQACCNFWGFEIIEGDDTGDVTLRWDAPPDAADLIDAIERAVTPPPT